MICANCDLFTKPYNDGTCEFCGESVIKANANQYTNRSQE